MTIRNNALTLRDCPPAGAVPADAEVYRCCKKKPPSPKGMQTHEEAGREPDADPCLRRALSVFRTEIDARHQVRLFRRWRRKFIAKASLKAHHGQLMATRGRQPTHTSWWPAQGLGPTERASLFEVVSEVSR